MKAGRQQQQKKLNPSARITGPHLSTSNPYYYSPTAADLFSHSIRFDSHLIDAKYRPAHRWIAM